MRTESHKKAPALAKVLLAVAALLGAMALYEVAEFLMTTAQAELAVARATESGTGGPNNVDASLAQAKSIVETLKKGNLFAPPPPKQNPVREVLGILGDEALINNKWYKAGDSVGDAKILAVGPTRIRVVWNGQEKEFSPLGSTDAGSQGGGGPSGPPRPGRRGRLERGARGPASPRANGPGGMSAEETAALGNRFRDASPEERAKLREEMRTRFAPPER